MKQLKTGQFHGQTNRTIQLDGFTLTDTEYTQEKVDWHYHENAYFTFLLQGHVIEGNKKEIYSCDAGSLLFHHWQEPHYNIKPRGFTRGFHIELAHHSIDRFDFGIDDLTGSMNISDPDSKLILYSIFTETKINDANSTASIQSLLLRLLDLLKSDFKARSAKRPSWVSKLKEILHSQHVDNYTLMDLSRELNIHPVHLSRDFHKHFKCNLGEYIRKLKIQKSLSLLLKKNNSLSDISFECGFSDQSHFTRSFKKYNGLTPQEYRKLIFS